MTDDVQEGAPTTPEAVEPVVPEVLEVEQEVQQPSVPSEGLTEDRLLEILAERDEKTARAAQSAKDRAISRNAKDIADILERFEASGDSAAEFVQETDRQATIEATQQWQAGIESRLQQLAVPTGADWQSEWAADSQKILDAAASNDVELTPEEYNAAMFNNGVAFNTKGDAYAALNQAIVSKAKGESISIAAVATEGGDVASPPVPPAPPKTSAQQFEEAKAAGDFDKMRQIQDERWDNVEKLQKVQTAQQALEQAGISAEDLLEQ